jgi:hypothetical protein
LMRKSGHENRVLGTSNAGLLRNCSTFGYDRGFSGSNPGRYTIDAVRVAGSVPAICLYEHFGCLCDAVKPQDVSAEARLGGRLAHPAPRIAPRRPRIPAIPLSPRSWPAQGSPDNSRLSASAVCRASLRQLFV